jgi:hypothetical protein
MSQIVLTHVMTQQQLEQYAASPREDAPFPEENTEVQPYFALNAPPMICLGEMLEEHLPELDTDARSDHVRTVRDYEIPLLFAWHHDDARQITAALERLEANPEALGAFYEAFLRGELERSCRSDARGEPIPARKSRATDHRAMLVAGVRRVMDEGSS